MESGQGADQGCDGRLLPEFEFQDLKCFPQNLYINKAIFLYLNLFLPQFVHLSKLAPKYAPTHLKRIILNIKLDSTEKSTGLRVSPSKNKVCLCPSSARETPTRLISSAGSDLCVQQTEEAGTGG